MNIGLSLKEDARWAEKGYELAWKQCAYPKKQKLTAKASSKNGVRVVENSANIALYAGSVMAVFDKEAGAFSSLQIDGVELLERGMKINLWRAPTDNDDGGDKRSYGAQWRRDGLDKLRLQVKQVQI